MFSISYPRQRDFQDGQTDTDDVSRNLHRISHIIEACIIRFSYEQESNMNALLRGITLYK